LAILLPRCFQGGLGPYGRSAKGREEGRRKKTQEPRESIKGKEGRRVLEEKRRREVTGITYNN
jgi:hypothetical protein